MNNIPIVVNNRNRLSTTRYLVLNLQSLGYTNIIILDNQSTYPELIQWYNTIEGESTGVEVIRLDKNLGHTALWDSGAIDALKKYPYIVYTDSDIRLNKKTPSDFIQQLINIAKDFRVDKVGLAIEYRDLPVNEITKEAVRIESRYWNPKNRIKHPLECYSSIIDTTFAVINPHIPYSWQQSAIRVAGDFMCYHMPWYNQDYKNLSQEEQYVLDHCDERFGSYKLIMKQLKLI